MYPVLSYAVAGFLGAVAVVALIQTAGYGGGPVARLGMKVGHGLVALVVLLDVIGLAQGHRPDDSVTHIGYAVTALGLPVLLLTRRPEPGQETADPPHPVVVAVAAIATAVVVWRLQETW